MREKIVSALLLALLLALGACAAGLAQETYEEEMDEDVEGISVVVYEDRAMFVYPDYMGDIDLLVDELNALADVLPERLNKFLLIAPKRISLEIDELCELSADEQEAARYIFRNIDPSIVFVDAYYTLKQHAGHLNDVYFRLDHHWTPLGAYYVAEAFLVSAGIDYHTLDAYTKIEAGEWCGWLSLLAADRSLYDEPDQRYYYRLPGTEDRTAVVYRPETKTREASVEEVLFVDPSRGGYSIFIGSYGFYQAIIRGDETRERSLLLIGGSSSYSICPFLADHFKTVVLIEPRRYGGGKQEVDDLIIEYGITDVLMMPSYTSRFLKLH